MHDFFQKYFSFTKGERNGIIVLFVILIIVIVTPYFIDIFYTKEYIDYSGYEKEVDAINSKIVENESTSSLKKRQLKLFNFNPNKATIAELKELGFSKTQINNLVKYRKKGGFFYKKEDLKKIYGIDNELYNRLKDYIVIIKKSKVDSIQYKNIDPNIINAEEWAKLGLNDKLINTIQNYLLSGGKFYKKKDLLKIYGFKTELYNRLEPFIKIDTLLANKQNKFKIIDINSADTSELYQIFNNNKQLVNRIVKYRNLLGGFYNKEQLKEVYGFSTKINLQYIKVDTNKIKKININTIDFKSLNKHPYVSFDETKAIFTYRKVMGGFTNVNELSENNLINKKSFNKFKPYIMALGNLKSISKKEQ